MIIRFLELRVPPLLVVIVIAGVMWLVASSLPPARLVPASVRLPAAVIIALAGVAIVLGGVISFRRAQTTVSPLKPETSAALVSTGIYRITRNPMYVGMLGVLLAWAAYLSSAWALLGPVAFVLYITRFQIIPEEKALRSLFGTAFVEYTRSVRRWL